MYIMITTYCNMTCEHCCFSCGPGGIPGEHMSRKTFDRCMKLAEEYGKNIALGGGEPTMHPEFRYFLLESIVAKSFSDIPPFIITNGSITDEALLLAKLAKAGVVSAELSLDYFHDPIDHEVVRAFTKPGPRNSDYHFYTTGSDSNDLRGIRNTSKNGKLYPNGRAIELAHSYEMMNGCACEDLHIKPNGDVHFCGCDDSPLLGNVHDDDLDLDIYHDSGQGCWKNEPEGYFYGYTKGIRLPVISCRGKQRVRQATIHWSIDYDFSHETGNLRDNGDGSDSHRSSFPRSVYQRQSS